MTSASKFWDWSLTHYERDGVEPLLLRLQDEKNLDANILLWCCWCAISFETLSEALVHDAMAQTTPWTANVTAPLRNARRHLKSMRATYDIFDAEALRAAIKQNELMAEKIEQELLEAIAMRRLNPKAATAHEIQMRANENLSTYASLSGALGKSECLNALLESLSRHIFADTSQEVCSKDGHGERR